MLSFYLIQKLLNRSNIFSSTLIFSSLGKTISAKFIYNVERKIIYPMSAEGLFTMLKNEGLDVLLQTRVSNGQMQPFR